MSVTDLFVGVIARAIADQSIELKNREAECATLRADSNRFLFSDDTGLSAICDAAKLQKDYVRRLARYVKAHPEELVRYDASTPRKKRGLVLNRDLFDELVPYGQRIRTYSMAGFNDRAYSLTHPCASMVKRQRLADLLGVDHDELWLEPDSEAVA